MGRLVAKECPSRSRPLLSEISLVGTTPSEGGSEMTVLVKPLRRDILVEAGHGCEKWGGSVMHSVPIQSRIVYRADEETYFVIEMCFLFHSHVLL